MTIYNALNLDRALSAYNHHHIYSTGCLPGESRVRTSLLGVHQSFPVIIQSGLHFLNHFLIIFLSFFLSALNFSSVITGACWVFSCICNRSRTERAQSHLRTGLQGLYSACKVVCMRTHTGPRFRVSSEGLGLTSPIFGCLCLKEQSNPALPLPALGCARKGSKPTTSRFTDRRIRQRHWIATTRDQPLPVG